MACCFAQWVGDKGVESEHDAGGTAEGQREEPTIAESGRSVFQLASENIKRFLRQGHLSRAELLQLKNDKLDQRRKDQQQAQSVLYVHKQSGLDCPDQLQPDKQITSTVQPAAQHHLQPLGYKSKIARKQQDVFSLFPGNNTVGTAGMGLTPKIQIDRTSANRPSPGLHAAKVQTKRTSYNGHSSVLQQAHGGNKRITLEGPCGADNNPQAPATQLKFKDLIQPATNLRSAAKVIAEFQNAVATAAAETVLSDVLIQELQETQQQSSAFGNDNTAVANAGMCGQVRSKESSWRAGNIVYSSLHQWLPANDKELVGLDIIGAEEALQQNDQQDITFNAGPAPLLGPGIGRHRVSGTGSNTWLSPPFPEYAAVRPHRATYTGGTATSDHWKDAVGGVATFQRRMSQTGVFERIGPTSGKPPMPPPPRGSLSHQTSKQAWGNSSESLVRGDGVIVVSTPCLKPNWPDAQPATARPGLAAVKQGSSAGGAPIPA